MANFNAEPCMDGGEELHESSYDLTLEFKSISYYSNNMEEMVRQMFRVAGISQIRKSLPLSIANMPIFQLQQACVKQLTSMDITSIRNILSGKIEPNFSKTQHDDSELMGKKETSFNVLPIIPISTTNRFNRRTKRNGRPSRSSETPSPRLVHISERKRQKLVGRCETLYVVPRLSPSASVSANHPEHAPTQPGYRTRRSSIKKSDKKPKRLKSSNISRVDRGRPENKELDGGSSDESGTFNRSFVAKSNSENNPNVLGDDHNKPETIDSTDSQFMCHKRDIGGSTVSRSDSSILENYKNIPAHLAKSSQMIALNELELRAKAIKAMISRQKTMP